MPGSPDRRTRCPGPSPLRFQASVSRASSVARPASPNALGMASRGGRPGRWSDSSTAGSQSTSSASSGSARPFSTSCPTGRNSCPPRPRAMPRTIDAERIWPGAAVASRRWASTTGSPKQSPSSSTVTSPTLSPIRTSRRWLSAVRLCRSIACWTATAAPTASAAPANVAITPSPVDLMTLPPAPAMAAVTRPSCVYRRRSDCSSPIRARSSVDPTRSVKRTVSVSTRPPPPPSAMGAGYRRLRHRTRT